MATPDDDERTVADRAKTEAEMPATKMPRTLSDAEATRVEPLPRLDRLANATDVNGSSEVPIVRELRSRDRDERDDRDRLAPPVPPSPPRGPMSPGPSAPTDPVGVNAAAIFNHPSAPTLPTAMDDEATRLAPKKAEAVTAPPMKKKPRPGPPLMARPAARKALQRLRKLTSEISLVSISSKSKTRRRGSRLILAVLVSFGVVAVIQLYKAFTSTSAEVARPLGAKKVEEPSFFDRLFKY